MALPEIVSWDEWVTARTAFLAEERLINGRADVDSVSHNPGRFILNFHVTNAQRRCAP